MNGPSAKPPRNRGVFFTLAAAGFWLLLVFLFVFF